MVRDRSVEFILNNRDNSTSAADFYRMGDIVSSRHNPEDFAIFVGGKYRSRRPVLSPRTVMLHVLNIPAPIIEFFPALSQGVVEVLVGAEGEDGDIDVQTRRIRLRRFAVNKFSLHPTVLGDLIIHKEATLTWTMFRRAAEDRITAEALHEDDFVGGSYG